MNTKNIREMFITLNEGFLIKEPRFGTEFQPYRFHLLNVMMTKIADSHCTK